MPCRVRALVLMDASCPQGDATVVTYLQNALRGTANEVSGSLGAQYFIARLLCNAPAPALAGRSARRLPRHWPRGPGIGG